MSELEKKVEELEVKAELAREEAEEKLADLKDDVGAAVDNAKEAVEQKIDEAAVQAELAKEEAEERFADRKDEVGAALDNFVNAAKDIFENVKESEAVQYAKGEDGKFDGEDVKRIAGDAVEAGKNLFNKAKGLFSKKEEE